MTDDHGNIGYGKNCKHQLSYFQTIIVIVMHKLSFIPTVQAHACYSHKFVLENDCVCVLLLCTYKQHKDSLKLEWLKWLYDRVVIQLKQTSW